MKAYHRRRRPIAGRLGNASIRLWESLEDGSLLAGGVDVGRIVAVAGAPVYIYDAEVMRGRYAVLRKALPSWVNILYSVKANPNLAVVRLFKKEGAGAEVSSLHELMTAIEAKVPRGMISFAGPGKSDEEINLAVSSRIGIINVESATELDRVFKAAKALGKKPSVAIRLNLEYQKGKTGSGHVMAGGASKLGADPDQAEDLALKASGSPLVDFLGFHLFPGTGILDAETLGGAYQALARFALEFAGRKRIPIKYINFGGGLGVPYKDEEDPLDITSVGRAVKGACSGLQKSRWFSGAAYFMEPGRYLAGPGGVYVCSIRDIKTSGGKTFVITDGGIHHALIPIVMNKWFPTAMVERMNEPHNVKVTVAGPLCATPDQFSRDVFLPAPRLGDLVGVFNSGAYGYSASMLGFLSHTAPAEVLADRGRVFLIRGRTAPSMGILKRIRVLGRRHSH